MIKYVQDKRIDFKDIEKLLVESAKLSRFTNGGPVKTALEQYLAKFLKLSSDKKVVVTSSGTTALHALMFFYEENVGKDLQWATISYNFPSAVVNRRKTKIFDILFSNNSYEVRLDDELKTSDGLILPTLFGTKPSNLDECIEFCQANNIILLLDNASSPINLSNLDAISFGSLHHTKYLGYGEGGYAIVDKDKYYELDSMTNFGFYQNRKYRIRSSNFKMSDVSAAFILSHIKNYSLRKHLRIQKKFVEKLFQYNILPFNYKNVEVYGNLPIVFKKPVSHLEFRDFGIEANKYYCPLDSSAMSSVKLYERMVNFPLHSELTDYEIDKIVDQIYYKESNL
jgi:dTDP-4-amino-4,6-dideoxygalactose transaminase